MLGGRQQQNRWVASVIFQLTYTSRASGASSHDICRDILAASRANNSRLDVTGLLICEAEGFLQTLEGSEQIVQILFDKIRKDNRHFNVAVLEERLLPTRQFGAWAMAYDETGTNAALQEGKRALFADLGMLRAS